VHINPSKLADVDDVFLPLSDFVSSDQDLILFDRMSCIAASTSTSKILANGIPYAISNTMRNSPIATVKRR
jgi:hypothetical protein